jgi:hypothetical protein
LTIAGYQLRAYDFFDIAKTLTYGRSGVIVLPQKTLNHEPKTTNQQPMDDADDFFPEDADFAAPGGGGMGQQGAGDELNIELTEEEAEGTYTNLVMIAHSPEEFILDFIRVMPGVQKARVKSRIIVTPQHARRLLNALEENLERYERAHGEIEERTGPDEPFQFGGFSGEA